EFRRVLFRSRPGPRPPPRTPNRPRSFDLLLVEDVGSVLDHLPARHFTAHDAEPVIEPRRGQNLAFVPPCPRRWNPTHRLLEDRAREVGQSLAPFRQIVHVASRSSFGGSEQRGDVDSVDRMLQLTRGPLYLRIV